MKHHNKYIKAIETCITQNAPKLKAGETDGVAAYIGTKHKVLGLGTLHQKALAKQNYDLAIDHSTDMPVFDQLFKNSKIFEIKNTALLTIDLHYKKLDKEQLFELMLPWVEYVDNWAHSDYLSKFYTRFLEIEKLNRKFLNVLQKWNSDKNPWKRRQSLVALLYYARTKKSHPSFDTVKNLVENLLNDKEYFVQKGVGWCLRECYVVYPELTYKFAVNNFSKISSVAFSAACEKMTEKEKNNLKTKRKAFRKNKK